VLSDGKKNVEYLMPLSMKERVLESLGVDKFYIVEFDKEFASLSPEQFAAQYLIGLGVTHAVAGFDFTYGSKGMGNMDRLRSDSSALFDVTKVPKVECRGKKISSTIIRETLLNGNVEEIPDYLGCYYEIESEWDGVSLKPVHYCTMPAEGSYFVTIKHKGVSVPAKIMVIEENGHRCLRAVSKIDNNILGKISIIWKERKRVESLLINFG
ncbi:FAD synthetase family protein, partial [Neobacillus niacini]|uniref:FAD synthetase family protein n=1 Tax=Neobacillus niacini TaxID=86668 RepID=UPI003001B4EE